MPAKAAGHACKAAYVGLLRRSLGLKPSSLWAMLAAYFDESGTHADSKILVLAGVISPVAQWEKLTRSWERVLSENGLPAFHTVDCAHRRNAFASWDAKACDALYRRLIQLTTRHVLWRTWSAILVPDYLQFFATENHDTARYIAYGLCAATSASRVRDLAINLGHKARIPYVFERGGLGGKFAARMLQDASDERARAFNIGALSIDSRDNLAPLQVADLHAYEVYKYFSDQIEESNRPVRRSFKELMRISEAGGGGNLLGVDKLRAVFDSLRDGSGRAEIGVDQLNNHTRICVQRIRN